jgi:hypothetical protein
MFRAVCLLLCLSSAVFAQTLNRNSEAASSPSSVVQVFYVLDGSTLITYNIDPQTLDASLAGTTTLPSSPYSWIVTSPNGQFLYYLTNFGYADQKLYVYDTNALGVPASEPVQTVNVGQLEGLVVNPAGTFLYVVKVGPVNQEQQTTQFSIVRNVIDPAMGRLSQPVTEATYQIDTAITGNDCYLSVPGFNPAGTVMYDGIICTGPYGAGSSTYNQRSVNLQTGALGPDQQVYYFDVYGGNPNVQFENNLMFAFVTYDNQGPNSSTVDVYQLPNTATPAVNCTASMWALCGDFAGALAHPSGEYVFLETSDGPTDIGQVNLQAGEITQVNSIPFGAKIFSPNGKIVYGGTSTQDEIDIAGFDAATGEVKQGGTIPLQPSSDYFNWVAERY